MPHPVPVVDATSLTKSYGAKPVLEDVSLTIHRGERVGLVGRNGSGKSTLARILAGQEAPDLGSVARRRGARVLYLSQEPELPTDATALDAALGGLEAWSEAKAEHDALSAELARGTGDLDSLLAAQAEAATRVERLGGWDRRPEAQAILSQLGVVRMEQRVGTLSGGERRRVALARLLVARPDLAILDEPTNHLDAEAIAWLEQHLLGAFEGALLLITHDRYLLDRVVSRTAEVEAGKLYCYDGGWEEYLLARAERQAHEQRAEANRQNFLRRELEWLRRQPKARTGKQKARIDRAEAAQSVEVPRGERELDLSVQRKRLGSTIVEAHDLELTLAGRTLVAGFTFHLKKGERIGVIGKNGAGKTTLLRALLGDIEPRAGRVVRGQTVEVAYLDQARSGLDDDETVYESVVGQRPRVTIGDYSMSSYAYLERFQLSRDKQRQPVAGLSGGERARVALAKLLLSPANVLVLDEPTNDLDVVTLGALEEMLLGFQGTALVVSHDRYFLDRVATSLLVVHGDGRVEEFPGNFSNYAERQQSERQRSRKKTVEPAPERTVPAGPKRLTYAERLELEGLMDRVSENEERVTELESALADPTLYTERRDQVGKLEGELAEARATVERLTARWEELEERRLATQ